MMVYLIWVNDDVMHVYSDQVRALYSAIGFMKDNDEHEWKIGDFGDSAFRASQPEGPYKRLEVVERTVL